MRLSLTLCLIVLGSFWHANCQELKLSNPGDETVVNYADYGIFHNIGTQKYRYEITKRKELMAAVGEGIFPNNKVYQDPEYKKLLKEGKLEGTHWNFIDNKNTKINFYKWATAQEDPGVKQYYTAVLFERLGMLKEAIKAYYAVVVHFPRTTSLTYWQTPWYMGANSIDKIEIITRRNPELGIKLVDAKINVLNGFNVDKKDDEFIVNPGKLIKVNPKKVLESKVKLLKKNIVKTIGGDNVKLVKYGNGHWQLLVDDKPYIIKAFAYTPNKVGLSPDRKTLNASQDWQIQDFNNNGIHDSAYESWIDKNYNNKKDSDEPTIGDFALLKDMGCNTLRIYHHVINKELFRDLYNNYGIMLIIGDLVGGYAMDSGANWDKGTDYEDPKQREKMLGNIRKMVIENKDEPYTLMWVLGNENVYGAGNNSDKKPEAFFKFLSKAASLIHELDPNHPVAISNGDLKFLKIAAENCREIDIFGANAYRGIYGFGRSFFENVKDTFDKPVLVTEFGCSAIGEGFTKEESAIFQSEYFKNNWEDISYHTAGSGAGNSLGGVAFEWIDEWWKANSDLPIRIQKQKQEWYKKRSALYKDLQPENHDELPQFGAPFIDGWSYEEWFGVFSQGDGSKSPFLRQKRPAFEALKNLWSK
ncbi:MAG: glycoside hydrolase family 2 TIM barrel-domain containing protein [bacterium]